jgi:hypothetical protein
MKNITHRIETKGKERKLIIEVDLNKEHGDSGSGKSITIASSEGNEPLGDRVFLGLNVYRKRTDEEYAKWKKDNPELAEAAAAKGKR